MHCARGTGFLRYHRPIWKYRKKILEAEKTRYAIPTESPVITVSSYYATDLREDTTIVNKAQLNKPSRILIEQEFDPTSLNFKREMSCLPFDEQTLIFDAGYKF